MNDIHLSKMLDQRLILPELLQLRVTTASCLVTTASSMVTTASSMVTTASSVVTTAFVN